jgi:hypothetical protein
VPESEAYLGDGVYAKFDGYYIILKANVPTTDTIFLEPAVYESLLKFAERIDKEQPKKDSTAE